MKASLRRFRRGRSRGSDVVFTNSRFLLGPKGLTPAQTGVLGRRDGTARSERRVEKGSSAQLLGSRISCRARRCRSGSPRFTSSFRRGSSKRVSSRSSRHFAGTAEDERIVWTSPLPTSSRSGSRRRASSRRRVAAYRARARPDRRSAATFDWDIIRKGSTLGFRTAVVPKEWGGHGIDFVTQALVMAELARGDSAIAKTFSQCWKWSHLIAAHAPTSSASASSSRSSRTTRFFSARRHRAQRRFRPPPAARGRSAIRLAPARGAQRRRVDPERREVLHRERLACASSSS